jgi:hypothetical protein
MRQVGAVEQKDGIHTLQTHLRYQLIPIDLFEMLAFKLHGDDGVKN